MKVSNRKYTVKSQASGSLRDQRDYYQEQAANDPDKRQRPLWQQLADELTHRIGDGPPTSIQEELLLGETD